MPSILTIMIDHLQGFIQIFFFKQGTVPRNHTQRQFASIQRSDKSTW